MPQNDTIVAISTPPGQGAIGVVRLSGPEAVSIVDRVFSKDLIQSGGYSLTYGKLQYDGQILDEVMVSVFRAPKSYTREDVVEVSCHGSPYILREALNLFVELGARPADAGEFTQRAYLNGAMDLAQAEAVADLIASNSASAHHLALNQMRGGVSRELKDLREQLLNFTSLIELELDFGEEDVEFADRGQLTELLTRIKQRIAGLVDSFRYGNAVKQGVPTVILGKPNAGKSTLLNALLNDNRAIVSAIPGTTRDVIEDRMILNGMEFRLMDTAGLRETGDVIEAEGVHRSLNLARNASLLLYIFDLQKESPEQALSHLESLQLPAHITVLAVANKLDAAPAYFEYAATVDDTGHLIFISALEGQHLDRLKQAMVAAVEQFSTLNTDQAIISNVRHLQALNKALASLLEVENAMNEGLSGDLLAVDIRAILHHLGEITGEISTEEVLGNIFSKFCIGK